MSDSTSSGLFHKLGLAAALAASLLVACGGGGGDGGSGSGSGNPSGSSNPPTPPPMTSGWSSGVRISNARDFMSTNIYAVAVDVNDTGTAVALWQEEDGVGVDRLWANVRRSGVWGTPTQVGNHGSLAASVSVMPNGDAIIAYVQQTVDTGTGFASEQHIDSRRYQYATGAWTVAETISAGIPSDAYALEPDVAADTNGNAMAVWQHQGETWARRYDAASGWSATIAQLSNSPRGVYTPKIVIDGNNVLTAVWIEDTAAFNGGLPGGGPNKPTVYARRYSAGSWDASAQRIGWADTDLLGDFDSAARIRVDTNVTGEVFVIWEQLRTLANSSLEHSVDTARFDPGNGTWSGPATIATHSAYLSWPQVAVDSSGKALAIWDRTETLGGSVSSVRGSWFDPASSAWGAPILIDETGTGDVSDVTFALDGAGNAEIVWYENGKGMIERRYNAGAGSWGTFNPRTPASSRLRLDMSDTGYAVLIGDSMDYSAIPWTVAAWSWVYTP